MSDQWYYGQNGVQKGPVGLEVMQQLLREGRVRPDDLVWREGMADWAPAASLPELQIAPPAPQPPPAPEPPVPPTPPPPPTVSGVPMPMPFDPASAALQSKANTAMVLGIISIVCSACICAPIGLVLGILALVMGQSAGLAPNAGNARAGVICGIIGIALSLVMCIPQFRYGMH